MPLPDGTTIHIRPIRDDDRGRLLGMWGRTGDASRRSRFHGTFQLTEHNVGTFTDLDPVLQRALVATLGRDDDERIVAVARYERLSVGNEEAEFAALVEDGQQGRGIGTALVRRLAQDAHEAGVRVLIGDILADNSRMLRLVQDLGLAARSQSSGYGSVRTDLQIDLGEEFLRTADEDQRVAATAALRRFLHPTSVAVVGASRDPEALGARVLSAVLSGGFTGVVYPVHRSAPHVQGVTAHADLASCPTVPDLAIICVPASEVPQVVDDAGRLGVRAVTVISAGFRESGEAGAALEAEVLSTARSHGLRLVGPNCMGLVNAGADVRLNGTFSPTMPPPGRIGMSSQSGALGLAVLEHVDRLGLGLSTFVSIGNKADISSNDLLRYWEEDPDTDVVLLYLESFGNPRAFSRIARRISRRKPIVAVKSGRTGAGRRAARDHTAALSSGDVAVDALFRQTGVIRTDTLQEMLDVATLLTSQPLPRGGNVVILTNAGGPGTLAADACESNGLDVRPLFTETQTALDEALPTHSGVQNPVGLTPAADGDAYAAALRVLAEAPDVDAVVVVFVPVGTVRERDVAAAITTARREIRDDLTVLNVFMGRGGMVPPPSDPRIPAFAFPEDAARALGRVHAYAAWRGRPLGSVVTFDDVDAASARRIVDSALARERDPDDHTPRWLDPAEAEGVLRAYGIPLVRSRVATDAAGAKDALDLFGGPVVVKVATPESKTDFGGVVLDVHDADAAAAAITTLRERAAAADVATTDGFLVQEQVDDGVEMVVGVTHDSSFGPLVLTGLGGTLVELVRDVAVRITPITDLDVRDMLDQLRMRPLLDGYRGSPEMDVPALEELLLRIGALVEDLPEVVSLDLNPVFVLPSGRGVQAADVRIRVRPQG